MDNPQTTADCDAKCFSAPGAELFVFTDVEEIGAGDIADLNKSTLVGYLPVGSGEPTREDIHE
jgi:hypothetical protein